MIKSIELTNFESHKHSEFVFSPYINIITGQSNHGKSSIIRGLYWIKDNKPAGNSMVSFWNRDTKGLPKDKTSVEIIVDSSIISREKSKDFNGYKIKSKEGIKKLEAIGQNVPDEITEKLNLSNTNIQYQFDRPFLLDESSAEVARIFNKVVHLDTIDKVQAKAEQLRRQTNSEITQAKETIKTLTTQIEALQWIEEAEKLENEYETTLQEYNAVKIDYITLNNLLIAYNKQKNIIEKWEKIKVAKDIIDEIDNLKYTIDTVSNEYNKLRQLYSDKNKLLMKLKVSKKILLQASIVDEIEELNSEIKKITKEKQLLDSILNSIISNKNIIEESKKAIDQYKNLLPSICPLCGSRIKQ